MIVRKKGRKTTAEYLFYISIIVSPLRCYGFVIGGMNFSFFRIAGVLMILASLISKRKIILNTQTKCITAIIFMTALQSLYSPYLSGAQSSFMSQFFGYIWILFVCQIMSESSDYSTANRMIVISAVIPLSLGLYQWVIYRTRGSIPSLPFQFMVSSEGKLGLTYNVYARITSCFGDPAYMTTFYVGVFAVAFQQLMLSMNNNIERKEFRSIIIIILILIILETVMSISVSGIFGLIVCMGLLGLTNSYSIKKLGQFLLVLTVLIMGFSIYFIGKGSELIDILWFKMTTGTQTSSNLFGRNLYIKNALQVWSNHPIWGGGFGSLSLNGSFSSAHSSLLTVLGQQGIIVFILNVVLLLFYPIRTFRSIRKAHLNEVRDSFLAPFLGLISVLALTLGYDTLYSLDFCYVLIAIVSSYGWCINREHSQN